MFDSLHLDSEGVTKAAHHILLLLVGFLFVTLVTALRMTTMAPVGAESNSSFRERTAIRAKLLVGVLIAPAIILLVALSGDILRLSLTFPAWGIFVISLTLLISWIIGRFLFLSRDDVGDYTIEANRRDSINAKWQAEKTSKVKLRRELIAWSTGIVVAIVWLLMLAHMGMRDVAKLFTS